MADTNRKQQTETRKPGRPKGSTNSTQGKKGGKSTQSAGNSQAKGRSSARKTAYEEEDTGFMRAEVVIICSFAVAILLFLSNFRLCGVVGEFLRGVQLGMFGILGYVLPVLLFVGTCFHLSNQGNIHAAVKLAAVIAAFLTLCSLFQLLFGTVPEGAALTEYYKQSSINGAGGGLAGGAVTSLLIIGVGRAGAYLVLIVLFIICMVCITERSFVSVVKRGGGKAYQYAREDMDRRRENHAQRTEERRRIREEQRVRGVNLDATKLEEPDDWDEEEFDREYGAELEEMPSPVPAAASRAEEDSPSALAREIEKHSRPEPRTEQVPVITGLKVEDETGVHEEPAWETIRVRKDSRTLEEMDIASHPVNFMDDLRDVPVQGIRGEKEDVPWDTDGPEKAAFGRELPGQTEQAAFGQELSEQRISGLSTEPEEESWQPRKPEKEEDGVPWIQKIPVRAQEKEDIPSSYVPQFPKEDISVSGGQDTYSEDKSEQGINYDSIFVAEEPKRVVTSSGKVIETETELLQKKIEKKREEAAIADANAAVAEEIQKKEEEVKKEYIFPPTTLLKKGARSSGNISENEYRATAAKLQQTLRNFGVGVTVTNISCGPAVTRYELLPEQGVKVSRIVGLTDDIKLSLAATDIRIEAPIPGKSAVGIEVPNKENKMVYLRDLLEADAFIQHKSRLAFAVGKDIGGQVVVTDIGKMPHLLIAGATGSGKSVCINTLIMSIIYKSKPEDVRLIMVDPKVVELSVYNGIPHLLIPVVTDPKKASGALNWAVAEMDDRYKKFAECNVRDLKGYNDRVAKLADIEDEKKPVKLPQIIIIIDELADLMMVAPGEVEDSICRLAQLARAAGIHLVIATQRPSVNVITGLIKANVPSRIAFAVSSGVDSRTIIDMNGAEKLLGKGDMLFYPAGFPKPQRVQGAFVSDEEVGRVVEFLTEQGMTADYSTEVANQISSPSAAAGGGSSGRDEYFVRAGQFIIEKDKASIGMLQRMFKIGFNRAARIMDQLAEAGVVGEEEGTKPRKVLMSAEQFEEMLEQGG
ncbi:FtsK/SpoIIIE family DNA translocase [Lacrimispora sp. 210928-DFI.3.58]|uniref:FtsK/SpoIIIE family DNA translocase n=1 Tax=Lacrimispora sp. 210928-DFI.3.58 TaxID=2883214 RepID=UPI001D095CCD|nr:DNA translocase FtsK [Lacrimispora sp. 210928-DFI.3.58]MCB7319754.1 DNA translocase FtsK [Lacrimispora sp. 210928-DFI.3.58]